MAIGNLLRRGRNKRFSGSVVPSQWQESTFAELAWDHARKASGRWAVVGGLIGVLVGLVAFAPATWLANAVSNATDQRLVLAEARGTVWSGSATVVLTGGPDSRDASALPGRLSWSLGLRGTAFALSLQQACCLNGTVQLRIQPGFGRTTVTLPPQPGWTAQWPAAITSGLGTPMNTMQLGGALRLLSPSGASVQLVQGRWLMQGQLDVEMVSMSSRLSTLDTLGNYRLSLIGSGTDQPARMELSTFGGALQLSGNGTLNDNGVTFRGEASAAENNEAALSNLLNIIGRRDGARSVISIG